MELGQKPQPLEVRVITNVSALSIGQHQFYCNVIVIDDKTYFNEVAGYNDPRNLKRSFCFHLRKDDKVRLSKKTKKDGTKTLHVGDVSYTVHPEQWRETQGPQETKMTFKNRYDGLRLEFLGHYGNPQRK